MKKNKMFLVLVAMAFLVTSQLGFSQTIFDDCNKLFRMATSLMEIDGELRQIARYYGSLGKYDRSSNINSVTYCVMTAVSEIKEAYMCLWVATMIKDKYKQDWRKVTENSIQYAIENMKLSLEVIAKKRPGITNTAALDSINRANNIINEALALLRKIENRGN